MEEVSKPVAALCTVTPVRGIDSFRDVRNLFVVYII